MGRTVEGNFKTEVFQNNVKQIVQSKLTFSFTVQHRNQTHMRDTAKQKVQLLISVILSIILLCGWFHVQTTFQCFGVQTTLAAIHVAPIEYHFTTG